MMLFTPIGGVAAQTRVSIWSYAGMAVSSLWDEEVRADMKRINWNPFNSDAQVAAECTKVSFYQGIPVFRAKVPRSGSFYAILLKPEAREGNTIKHERGHAWQAMILGPGAYGIAIGIPSFKKLGPWDDDETLSNGNGYYHAPWELNAELLGGVSRPDMAIQGWEKTRSWVYLVTAMLSSPLCYLFLINPKVR